MRDNMIKVVFFTILALFAVNCADKVSRYDVEAVSTND
jgi:hypothetical protein